VASKCSPRIRTLDLEELRTDVYIAVRPGIIFDAGAGRRRYQSVRLAIEPSGKLGSQCASVEAPQLSRRGNDAMPIIT
jgi:hypothetical protein